LLTSSVAALISAARTRVFADDESWR